LETTIENETNISISNEAGKCEALETPLTNDGGNIPSHLANVLQNLEKTQNNNDAESSI